MLMSILTFITENYHVIGSSTALTLLLTKLLDKYIRKDELNLQAKLNTEVELLKGQLNHQNSRLHIAYSGVYREQVDALKKLYSLLLDYESSIHQRRNPSIIDPEKYLDPNIILNSFKTAFYENAIFIPQELENRILHIIGFGFSSYTLDKFKQAEIKAIQGDIDTANKLSADAIYQDAEFRALRDDLRSEIRKVLAIDEEKAP